MHIKDTSYFNENGTVLAFSRQSDAENMLRRMSCIIKNNGFATIKDLRIITKSHTYEIDDEKKYGWFSMEDFHLRCIMTVRQQKEYHLTVPKAESVTANQDAIKIKFVKEMVFHAENGQELIFDDFSDNLEEYDSYWAELCPDCYKRYGEVLGNRVDECGCARGICSIKGCANEADYYIDFKANEVVINTKRQSFNMDSEVKQKVQKITKQDVEDELFKFLEQKMESREAGRIENVRRFQGYFSTKDNGIIINCSDGSQICLTIQVS